MNPLAHRLAKLSAEEMVASLGMQRGPAYLRKGLAAPFFMASRGLGKNLAELDDAVATLGLPRAATQSLARFGVALRTTNTALGTGAALVLANHPGAYDALALMSALERRDLLVLAADRTFLRALPQLSRHFVFVGQSAGERAGALKRALSCLRGGGAVLHFPAGDIEPDADFESDREHWLKPWRPGVSALVAACARANGRVLVAGVRGVHSPRAKRFVLNRLAERRGVTTLSLLLQTVGKLRDVVARVCCSETSAANVLAALDVETQQSQLRAALSAAISRA